MDNVNNRISISEGGDPKWTFSNIYLEDYRKSVKIDFENYQKEFAYSTMREGDLEQAQSILEDILDDDPENIQALNALGIISYVIDNNQDAIKLFTEVIEYHPNSTSGYLNRSCVYKYQGDFEKAIIDISKAITIDKDEADLYMSRADLYADMKKWNEAKNDIEKALGFKNYDSNFDLCLAYYKKGMCEAQLGDNKSAEKNLLKAMEYTTDSEMKQVILSALERISPRRDEESNSQPNSASTYFKGVIGSFPITMFIKVTNAGKAQGWYYYNSKGSNKKLILSGLYNDEGEIVMNEFDENGINTGKFVGQYEDGVYKGSFYAYGNSQSYDFYLTEL